MQVRVVEGAAKGRVYPLDAPNVLIGRMHPEAVPGPGLVLIDDDTVSRQQAELQWNPNTQAYSLINRSQTNPTKVNEVATERVELAGGDQIRMGRCVLDLQAADMRFGAGQADASDGLEGWQSQEITLADGDVPRTCLALVWSELSDGFELFRRPDCSLEVFVERREDDLDWIARVAADRTGTLRAGDVIQLGATRLRLRRQEP